MGQESPEGDVLNRADQPITRRTSILQLWWLCTSCVLGMICERGAIASQRPPEIESRPLFQFR